MKKIQQIPLEKWKVEQYLNFAIRSRVPKKYQSVVETAGIDLSDVERIYHIKPILVLPSHC